MPEYEWEMTDREKMQQRRNNYRQYGLSIFESFEEYCRNLEEEDEH